MILVDSSVWIDHLRGRKTQQVAKLQSAAAREPLLIGDLILLEVLQGARDDIHAGRIERNLLQYTVAQLLNEALAVRAAQNYRRLRALGATVRKTVHIVIGTFCIETGHVLLHDDRDFLPMEKHLGLEVL